MESTNALFLGSFYFCEFFGIFWFWKDGIYCHAGGGNMGLLVTRSTLCFTLSRMLDVFLHWVGVSFFSNMKLLKLLIISICSPSICVRLGCMIGVVRFSCWNRKIGRQMVIRWMVFWYGCCDTQDSRVWVVFWDDAIFVTQNVERLGSLFHFFF